MAIDVTIFADASPRAIAAFRGMPELDGARYLLPYRTPGIVAPPMGLLAARDRAWLCLDRDAHPTDEAGQWSLEAPPHAGLPPQIWGAQRHLYPEPSRRGRGSLPTVELQWRDEFLL